FREERYPQLRDRWIALRKTLDDRWARAINFRRITNIDGLIHYLREFHRPWMESPALDPSKGPADLPHGLSAIYRELGGLFQTEGHSPFAAQDHLASPDQLRRLGEMTEFAWEAQWGWSCRCPQSKADPPVYVNLPEMWDFPDSGSHSVH